MKKAIEIIKLCEEEQQVTPSQAKKIVADFLKSNGLDNKLTAKTIGFSDLARGSSVFVAVHDWEPNPLASTLTDLAKENGFRVEFKGSL